MCEAMSGIIPADRIVRWSDTDESHNTIVIQHKLHEGPSFRVGGANYVAYEYSPPNKDYRLPIDQWVYRVDDAFPLPDWYDEAECKALALEALPRWIAQKIVLPGETREITNGHIVACYGDVCEVSGAAQISEVSGAAQISKVSGDAKISYVYGAAKISKVYGDAKISYVYGAAKISEVYGDAQISEVSGDAQISKVYGDAKISEVSGDATVTAYTAFGLSALKSPQAVLIDRTGDVPVCYVGIQKPKRARAKKSE